MKESITDGPGIRYTLFTQGCPHHCPGCHNPQTHDFSGGQQHDLDELFSDIQKNPLVHGITLSGGEPFCQAEALLLLCKRLKAAGYEIAAYSGYTFEELISDKGSPQYALLAYIDVLIDGPFLQDKKSLLLKFKGSSNQRIIQVPASLKEGRAVLETSPRWV